MKRRLSLLVLPLFVLLLTVAHAQTAAVTGNHVHSGSGGLLSSGNWCFNNQCLAVTNGVIASGVVHQGAGTISVNNGSGTIYLTIPGVSITSTVFPADSYAVSGTAFGMGVPIIPCIVGAIYYQTDASNARYTCVSTNGEQVWSNGSSGSGGAALPYPGIVYGTSSTGATVATSSQIQSAIGSGVYDASGAAAAAQSAAETYANSVNTTGNAANVTGVIAIPNGGTGSTTPATALKVLGGQIAGTTNISAFGDSLTAGNQDGLGDNYPGYVQAATNRFTKNYGVGGQTSTQILSRFANTPGAYNDFVLIWAGRNDPTASISSATTEANIASMVSALPAGARYLVMSIVNDETQVAGSTPYKNFIAINNSLAAAYPNNYLDIREALVGQYNPANPVDVQDHTNDVPPYSLRSIDYSGTLSAALTSSSCSFSIGAAPTGIGAVVAIGSEYIEVTGYSGANVTACVRGYAGSTAAAYASGTAFTVTDYLHLGHAGYSYVASQVAAFLTAHDPQAGTLSQVTQNDQFNNVRLGGGALVNTVLGSSNDTAVGFLAGLSITTGTGNSGFGASSLAGTTTGSNNAAFGNGALAGINTSGNSAFGTGALQHLTTGYNDVAMGLDAAQNTTTGADETIIGYLSFTNGSGSDSTCLGYLCLSNSTSAAQNTAVGSKAMLVASSGGNNVAVGYDSLANLTTGSSNAAVGMYAGGTCVSCTSSEALGEAAQLGATVTGAGQIGNGTNSTNNSLQFQGWNFLTSAGAGTFSSSSVVGDLNRSASLNAQTAAIASTALVGAATVTAASEWRVDWYIDSQSICAKPGSAAVSLTIGFTDESGARTETTGNVALGTNGATSQNGGSIVLWTASGDPLNYSTTYTGCTSGTGTYGLRLAAQQVQ